MHVLYIHQNFPAQFGHIASHLAKKEGWRSTFISQTAAGQMAGIEKIQYHQAGGATHQNHFCSRTFENTIWHCDAVYRTMKARPDIQPDLIVGHSGFGSTLFLRELYPKVPCLNFFEYYYHPHGHNTDMDFRQDLGWVLKDDRFQRARCRNAMILLDLQNCQAAYAPTVFQRSRFPSEYRSRIEVVFDGIDRTVFHGHDETLRPPLHQRGERIIAGVKVSASTRVVTYISRGFESMRGFDIFIRAAGQIARQFPDVLFFVIGSDRIAYGGDLEYLDGAASFKDWVFAREKPDLSKFVFPGRISPIDLAPLLAATDLHIYLTVPFVLSWSMMNAMSCGAVVLGSATAPVQEMIRDGENGMLADFFNVDAIVEKAITVLRDPDAFRPLGRAAEKMVAEKYALNVVMPAMERLYEKTVNAGVTRDDL